MEKDDILREYYNVLTDLENRYHSTDGAKYLRSIPRDPYGSTIDMPKDKFPEFWQWHQQRDDCYKKYHRLIQPFADFKKGDIVIVNHCEEIYVGEITSEAHASAEVNKNKYSIYYKCKHIYSWNSNDSDTVEENHIVKTIDRKYFQDEVKKPLQGLKAKMEELFKKGKIKNTVLNLNDDPVSMKIISDIENFGNEYARNYKNGDIEQLNKIKEKIDKCYETLEKYSPFKKDEIVILKNDKDFNFAKINQFPHYDKYCKHFSYDLIINYGWISEYPFGKENRGINYEQNMISKVDKALLEKEIIFPLYDIYQKIKDLIVK